jgi:tetratricopeptide (TPR) repeat protein
MPGHYTIWLGYGLLQQGRLAESRAHLELVRRNLADGGSPGRRGSLMFMRATHLINGESWSDQSLLFPVAPAGVSQEMIAVDAFARAYAALRTGHLEVPDTLLAKVNASPVLRLELEALGQLARRDTAGGLALLRRATTIEDTLPMAFGPPDIIKPAHELMGEQLLALGRAAEAKRAFQRALELAPGRLRSLLGLHRAAAIDGDSALADRAMADLRRMLVHADSAVHNSL